MAYVHVYIHTHLHSHTHTHTHTQFWLLLNCNNLIARGNSFVYLLFTHCKWWIHPSFSVHLQNCEKGLLAKSYPSVHLFVCLHGTTPLPLDGFSWSLIFEDLKKNLLWKLCHKRNHVITHWIILRIRDVSDKSCREK